MNSYDRVFFKKYTNQWNDIIDIAHQHIIVILSKILINFVIYVGIPTFLYYSSDKIKSFIPFFWLEIYLLLMFIKICYDIIDWYNDVWIITSDSLIDLDWSLFTSTTQTLKYENIEWIELIQWWFIDTVLWKWEIVANKVGWEWFVLTNAARIYQISQEIDNASKDIIWERDFVDQEDEYQDGEYIDEYNNDDEYQDGEYIDEYNEDDYQENESHSSWEHQNVEEDEVTDDFHNENKKLKEEHKEFTYKSNKNIKHNNTHSNIKNRKNYTNEDKLDKLIEVLSWVIESQIWKSEKINHKKDYQEVIQKAKKEKWTIDLR